MSKGLTDTIFALEFQPQRGWDWKVAFYLYGAGTASGLIFLELVLRGMGMVGEPVALWGIWTGLALVLLSLAVVFDHLGPRSRRGFFYVFRNLRTSMMARGSVIDAALVILLAMLVLPSLPGFSQLPWGEGTAGGIVLRAGVLIFAAAFMAYSGLVLCSSNSIAFWNTPLLPVLYIGYSFLGGMAALPILVFVLNGETGLQAAGPVLWPSLLVLLVANGFVLLLYVWGMSTATNPARESVRRLVRGECRWSFWLGVVGTGLVVPAAIVAVLLGGGSGAGSILALSVACAAVQVGCFLLRDTFLRVGVYGYPV
jgi:protein NrfD